jgi:Glutamate decarboxylase and related PLP-dependent proteins
MSPAGTAIEGRVVRWMCDLAGFGPASGGAFTSGGTEATFTALLAARAAALPDAWTKGVGAQPPVVLHGEHAHYAVSRAVGALGLGTDAAVAVPSRGLPDGRRRARGRAREVRGVRARVMAVVATAGSTATGSFDDLSAIGRLCDAHGVWLHVDGAHGASALFSAAHRGRLDGISSARSLAWDPHKMMLMPLSAGVLLVRDERDLDAAFAQRAPYLFHGAEGERSPDQGKRSFQCSRRLDALKVWVALQRYGADGLGSLYDGLCARPGRSTRRSPARPDFETLHEPESNILCFRYVGAEQLDAARLERGINLRLREDVQSLRGRDGSRRRFLGGRRVLRATQMNPADDAGRPSEGRRGGSRGQGRRIAADSADRP